MISWLQILVARLLLAVYVLHLFLPPLISLVYYHMVISCLQYGLLEHSIAMPKEKKENIDSAPCSCLVQ